MGAEDFLKKVGEKPKTDVLESIINNLSKEEIAELINGLKNKMEEIDKSNENLDPTKYKTLNDLNLKNLPDTNKE